MKLREVLEFLAIWPRSSIDVLCSFSLAAARVLHNDNLVITIVGVACRRLNRPCRANAGKDEALNLVSPKRSQKSSRDRRTANECPVKTHAR